MPYADTLSGLQAAVQAGDQANRSSLENSLARLIQVSQFREGKQKEDALKERQFQFAQQQHADLLKQQALSNTRNAQLDDDAWLRWNAQLDSNEGIKTAAADDRAATQQQAEDDRRFKMVNGLLNIGQITNPNQLTQFHLAPGDQEAATGILKGLASEAAARQATDQNAAAVANMPAVAENTSRSERLIQIGKQAQELANGNGKDLISPLSWLGGFGQKPLPEIDHGPTIKLSPIQASAMVAPRIDPRQTTIDATTGLAVPLYRSPYTIPVAQGANIARPSPVQAVDYGHQLMTEAQDAIARGANPDAVWARVQEALSRQ